MESEKPAPEIVVPEGYVLVERERFERLQAAASLNVDGDEFYFGVLEPGDLDPIE